MDPLKSWALVALGTGAAWYYYSRVKGPSTRKGRGGAVIERSRRDTAKLKQKKEELQNGSDSAYGPAEAGSESNVKEKARKKKPTKVAEEPAPTSTTKPVSSQRGDHAGNDDVDNKEFARQLAGLKKGTSLAPPTRSVNGGTGRTIKAKEAKPFASESNTNGFSPASSTTGADGDDDLSSAASPPLKATEKVNPSLSGDISDMLEPAAPGPAILRITEATGPVRQQVRRETPVETQETKKQRQNRKKAEEKKAARQEAEKDRRVLLEKQMRTAREAEGRPAKNGLSMAKPPSASAWAASPKLTNGNGNGNAISHNTAAAYDSPLLDTFDPKESKPSKPAKETKSWGRELPSEEEQIRILAETDDSSWSTVNKKTKKKAPTSSTTATGTEDEDAAQTYVSSNNPYSHAQDLDWEA